VCSVKLPGAVFFRQVLHEDLGCASYVIADRGEAAVVDPQWDVEDYLALADEHGFQITHILETHNHADHLSGHGRLAAATGAAIHVSAEADAQYEHERLRDGDVVEVGRARIRALGTPGHRPEHLAFVVEDATRGDTPWLLLTGDSLFVADLARPDLAVEPEEGAAGLFRSLRRLRELPEFVEVWPGHIGGSLCGGAAMSKKPSSTLGYERRFNRFLQIDDESDFVRALTSETRPQPPNFEHNVQLNRGALIERAGVIEPLAPGAVDSGAMVLDGRTPREFDSVHIRGSVNDPMVESGVGTRGAWIFEPEDDVVVVAASDADARRLARLLEAAGARKIRGYLAGGISAWQEAERKVDSTPAIDVRMLAERLERRDVVLLDVREDDEWQEGHVEGSLHVPYHQLVDGVPDEVRAAADGKPLAVACSAGIRSSTAASLLKRHGVEAVEHVADGGVDDLDAASRV
jgi:hydroxyacylglutathione hydrolase